MQELVRQLDVLWNGEDGAARQASLCDIVSQIEVEFPKLRSKVIDEIKKGLDLDVVIISDDLGNNGYRCEDVDALIKRMESKP